MFTSNVRQAFEFPDRLKGKTFRQIYEYTRLPLSFVFGGFPVKVGLFKDYWTLDKSYHFQDYKM